MQHLPQLYTGGQRAFGTKKMGTVADVLVSTVPTQAPCPLFLTALRSTGGAVAVGCAPHATHGYVHEPPSFTSVSVPQHCCCSWHSPLVCCCRLCHTTAAAAATPAQCGSQTHPCTRDPAVQHMQTILVSTQHISCTSPLPQQCRENHSTSDDRL